MATLTAIDKGELKTSWAARHNDAMATNKRQNERHIINMMRAWAAYADAHKSIHGDVIGNDGYASNYFEEIAHGINGLLSMDIGRLDGGTLNRFILDTLEENGCDPNEA